MIARYLFFLPYEQRFNYMKKRVAPVCSIEQRFAGAKNLDRIRVLEENQRFADV